MRELSLFTGAGGGLLGSLILGWRTVAAVEIDPYCQRVLCARGGYMADASGADAGGESREQQGEEPTRGQSPLVLSDSGRRSGEDTTGHNHFPVYSDIRTFDGTAWRGRCDIVSGGFPCQPFSQAGKRLGADDPRNMWPHTVRVLVESGAPLGFFENVPGLLSSGYFGTVLGDLAEAGFDAEWTVLGADDVGAPHRRKRLWILAYRHGDDAGMHARAVAGTARAAGRDAALDLPAGRCQVPGGGAELADAQGQSQRPGLRSSEPGGGRRGRPGDCRSPWHVDPADVGDAEGRQQWHPASWHGGSDSRGAGGADARPDNWLAQPCMDVMAHGLADWLGGRIPRVAVGVPERVNRLRALGNGQVPQTMAAAFTYLAGAVGVNPSGKTSGISGPPRTPENVEGVAKANRSRESKWW